MQAYLTNSVRRGGNSVEDWLETNMHSPVLKKSSMGSSSWASSAVYELKSGQKFFVKQSLGRDEEMFKGEALGLQAMYGGFYVYLL